MLQCTTFKFGGIQEIVSGRLLAADGPAADPAEESGEPLALESMSSEQLYDLAKRKARQEETLMQGPLREAVDHLREIVGLTDAAEGRLRSENFTELGILIERAVAEVSVRRSR